MELKYKLYASQCPTEGRSCLVLMIKYSGRVAQLVARVLSMHKVAGSIPASSRYTFWCFLSGSWLGMVVGFWIPAYLFSFWCSLSLFSTQEWYVVAFFICFCCSCSSIYLLCQNTDSLLFRNMRVTVSQIITIDRPTVRAATARTFFVWEQQEKARSRKSTMVEMQRDWTGSVICLQ